MPKIRTPLNGISDDVMDISNKVNIVYNLFITFVQRGAIIRVWKETKESKW